MKQKGVLQVLSCYVLWGCLPIFWKQLQAFSPLYILATRIVWSGVFCLLLLCGRWREVRQTFRDRRTLRRLLASAVMVGINWGSYIYAVNSGHMLDASLAYFLHPLLAILIGHFAFREPLRPAQCAALCLAFAGIVYTSAASGKIPWFALVIGGSFAAYGAIKRGVQTDGTVSTCVESLLLAPISLLYLLLPVNQGAAAALPGFSLLLLPLSGVVTAIPLLLYSQGIKQVSFSLSGILMYVNPTLQMLLGLLLYGEHLTGPKIVMFLCVWAALLLYLCAERRKIAK